MFQIIQIGRIKISTMVAVLSIPCIPNFMNLVVYPAKQKVINFIKIILKKQIFSSRGAHPFTFSTLRQSSLIGHILGMLSCLMITSTVCYHLLELRMGLQDCIQKCQNLSLTSHLTCFLAR